MNIDFSHDDLSLLKMLLSKAEVETRVEIHHSKRFEYRDYLKQRDEQIQNMLKQIKAAVPDEA